MAEYIDREAALMKLMLDGCSAKNVQSVMDIPAADVALVVHGEWTHLGGDEWWCSVCGFVITTEGSWDKPDKKYCEGCGAKMDKEEDNDQT